MSDIMSRVPRKQRIGCVCVRLGVCMYIIDYVS